MTRLLLLAGGFLAAGLLAPSLPSERSQFERIGPFGGDVRSLLMSAARPDVVYLGTTDGRIFQSVDAGRSWTPLVPGIGRRQLVIDTLIEHPRNPDHLFAGAWDLLSNGGSLFESLDAGRTWAPASLPHDSLAVRDFAISKNYPDHRIVGALSGAFVTQDGGRTWRKAALSSGSIQNVESVAIDPRDPRFLFAGTRRLGYRSTDGGRTWTRVEQGMLLDSHIFSLFVDPADPERIFASACSGLYRSSNRAAAWTRLKVLPDKMAVRAQKVLIDPVSPQRVYVGTTQGFFISDDGGQKWRLASDPDLTVNAFQIDPRNNRRILLGTQNRGVLRSEDGGRTWSTSNHGFVQRKISRILADPQHPERMFMGIVSDGRDGGFYTFHRRVNQWTAVTGGIGSGVEILSFLPLPDGKGRLAGTAAGIYLQRQNSTGWVKLKGRTETISINDLAVDPAGDWIFAGTSDGVYRSSPNSMDFQRPVNSPFAPRVSAILISRQRAGYVYAGSSIGVLFSPDGGDTWKDRSWGLPSRSMVESLAQCPTEPTHLFAGTLKGLYESRDEGESWQRISDHRLAVEVASVIYPDPSGRTVLAADSTHGGLFLSSDDGRTWRRLEAAGFDSPVRYIARDLADDARVYLGTSSDGVYRVRLPPPSDLPASP